MPFLRESIASQARSFLFPSSLCTKDTWVSKILLPSSIFLLKRCPSFLSFPILTYPNNLLSMHVFASHKRRPLTRVSSMPYPISLIPNLHRIPVSPASLATINMIRGDYAMRKAQIARWVVVFQ
ncbi:hypothetical protein EYC80_009710 [Monilinia laxa]|uniref:Uncharacterized protein n=1 Tax=Monilinia laxa TaxID=61186 RepID=A0A5N6JYP4_MONLA|nr:hypothetical protein EYC80_009710 [Monilinia laxa]